MLRVTLNPSTEVESVLRSSFRLQEASDIETLADVPCSKRQVDRLHRNSAKSTRDITFVFVRGVPEL